MTQHRSAAWQIARYFAAPGNQYGIWQPESSGYTADDAVEAAFQSVIPRAAEAAAASDAAIGKVVLDALSDAGRPIGNSGDSIDTTYTDVGRWLRPHAEWLALYTPAPQFPEPPRDLNRYHPAFVARLTRWMLDGRQDVAPGVDTQARALSTEWGSDLWPCSTCSATGEFKDYLGAAMRWKGALLSGIQTPGHDFKAGDRHRVVTDRPDGTTLAVGDVVEVIEGRSGSDTQIVHIRAANGREWWLTDAHLDPSPVPGGGIPLGREQAARIGRRIASAFALEVADYRPDSTGITTLEGMWDHLATHFRGKTWDQLEAADPETLLFSMMPSTAVEAVVAKAAAFTRENPRAYAGGLVKDAIRAARTAVDDDDAKVEELGIEALRQQPEFVALEQRVDTLRQWRDNAYRDMERLSAIFITEADDRSWCSEYDQIVERVNSEMRVLSMETRAWDYRVDVSASVSVTIEGYEFSGTMSLTLSVQGVKDPEDLPELIDNDMVADEIRSELGGFSNWDLEDWEVTDWNRDD